MDGYALGASEIVFSRGDPVSGDPMYRTMSYRKSGRRWTDVDIDSFNGVFCLGTAAGSSSIVDSNAANENDCVIHAHMIALTHGKAADHHAGSPPPGYLLTGHYTQTGWRRVGCNRHAATDAPHLRPERPSRAPARQSLGPPLWKTSPARHATWPRRIRAGIVPD